MPRLPSNGGARSGIHPHVLAYNPRSERNVSEIVYDILDFIEVPRGAIVDEGRWR